MRVVADHVRATTFLIGDGVMPGNEGRGYVLRKIMRRAMRHGRKLGIEEAFLSDIVHAVVERMSSAYPELINQEHSIIRVVKAEEERFASTLRLAMNEFRKTVERLPAGSRELAGADAFRLYDTYGLALDFIEELAQDYELSVDRAGFERELEAQRERARQASRLGAVSGDPVYMRLMDQGRTVFVGYETLVLDDAKVLAVLKGGALARRLDRGEEGEIVLDRTPFYANSGGQVGDHGVISAPGSAAEVTDTTQPLPGLHVHHVKVTAGGFEAGLPVRAEVDAERRAGAMRHHTATHLLHAALRDALGPHVKQAGSLVAPERLRFDFSHFTAVDPPQLRHVENQVNEQVLRDAPVERRVMGREAPMCTRRARSACSSSPPSRASRPAPAGWRRSRARRRCSARRTTSPSWTSSSRPRRWSAARWWTSTRA
jgi:alanyl-tRNA synthetase